MGMTGQEWLEKYTKKKQESNTSSKESTETTGKKLTGSQWLEKYTNKPEQTTSTTTDWDKFKQYGNSEEGAAGWQKYLADQEAKLKGETEKETEKEDKKWWEKLGDFLGEAYGSGGVVDTSLPMGTTTQVIHSIRDTGLPSHTTPEDDWNDEQRNIFGYLYSISPVLSSKYAEYINTEFKEKEAIQKVQDSATDNIFAGAAHTAGAIATAPLGLADFLNDLVLANAGASNTQYDGNISPFEYSQAVTGGITQHLNEQGGTLNENIPIIGGKGWGDVYGLGTSIAQSAISGYTMGGVGTLVSYFGQGAASGVDDALSRGASENQAILYGTVLGVAEGLAEQIGIDNLFKLGASPTLKVAIKNILKQAGAEGMEEGLTSIISNIADNAIMQDQSNFNAMVKAYMEQGMTEEKAKQKAWMDSIEGIAFDALAGAVSGGVHAGVHTGVKSAIDNHKVSQTYGDNQSIQDLLVEAVDIGGEAANVGDKYLAKYEKKGKLSGANLNEIIYTNEQELRTQDKAKIKAVAEAKLTEYGETGNVSAIADILVKQASGEKLTSKEANTLNKSKAGHQVSGELNRENLKSGGLANDWAADIGTERINADVYNREVYDLAQQKINKEDSSASKPKVSIEPKFKVSESGNTTYKGEEVSIKEIASIKDGDITLRLENGETINANDVEFSSSDEMLYATIVDMNLNAATANAFIRGFNATDGLSAEQYALGFREAYKYGSYGFPVQEMSRGGFSAGLSESQKSLAYGLGKVDAKYAIEAKQNAVKNTKVTNEFHEDSMSIEEAEAVSGLTDRQKTSIQAMKSLSESLGIKVRFFESAVDAKGKRVGENGRYDPETGILYIDLHAGLKGEGTILFTAAHELTHYIRQWSPAKFKVFADFLLENYGKKGVSVDALVRAQIEKAARKGRDISYDTAYEEVIADSCEAMLADGDAITKIAKLKAQDKSLWKKIKDFITDLVNKIKEAYKDLKPDSLEGRLVGEMLDVATNLKTLWTEALIDAGENYAEVRSALGTDSVIEVNENGEFTVGQTKDGTVLFNDRTYEEGGREALRETLITEGFSADDIKAALTILDAKHELVKRLGKDFSEQDKVNKATLTTDLKNGDAVLSALVSNGDYPVNIDLLMVCKKRLAYQRVINRLCETGLIKQATLDSLAIAEINKILGKYGFETACLGCFVESRRIRIQEWAETICKEWNGIVDKMVSNAKPFNFASETYVKDLSNKEVEDLSNDLEAAYERDGLHYGRQTVVKKMEQLLREVPSLRKRLSVADLITPQGRTHIKSLSSELNSLIACRYGSNTPKIVQDFNPYNHELAKYGKVPTKYSSLREYLYAIGGARMQSFSDFIIENWFDYAQIVADLAARKLPMHTYTKEIALVKLFGMTGIKINMSLIPDIDRSLGKEYAGLTKNAKGEYELIWADKDRFKVTGGKSYMQSINFADAIALQADPRYSSNVGTIAVGISKKHIEMMLDDARIRMIIPYHSSGMNPIFAQLVGTDYYKDYTDVQNTRVAYLLDSKGNRKDLKLEKSQKDNLTSGFEFNETLQKLGDARAATQAYLDWCADASKHTIKINGETYTAVLTPKFDEFAYHDNYYKLIEDFNTYDCITEQPAQQGDVQQIYPDEFEKVLTDELKDREAYRQKQEPKWETAMGEIEDYLKTHTKADTKAYAKEHGIKLSKKDLKLSDRDSEGNTLTAEQQEFFKDSKVRDKKGNLMVLYHGTTANFNTFKKGDVGFHFGTKGAARGRVGFGKNVTLKEVYLNITNPIVFDEDLGSWDADFRLTRELYDKGILTQAEAESVLFTDDRQYKRTTEASNKKLTSVLLNKGYDGIAYSNTFETKKATTSYIVFNSNQAKEITNTSPTSNPDIRYSDREIQPITETEYETLKKHFGVTANFRVAGYLLPDGKLLDFSGKHWGDTTSRSRQVDHRDVQEVLERGNNGISDMVDMIGSGSIRLMPETGGINLAVYPNEKQRRVLSLYIKQMLATEGQVIIDYDAVGGDTVHSRVYEKFASSTQILSDIRNYFNGARQSDLMRFRSEFSDRDPDAVSNRSLLANALESVAQNDIEKTKLAQYKEKIALIEAEQKKLTETRAKIKELSFAKGARDAKAIKDLQFEANQIANRINTYDKQLLGLESTKALKGVLEREKANLRKRLEKQNRENLANYREKAAKTQRELLTRYQESRKNAIEGRHKTAMRQKIQKVVSDLNKLLLNPTKEQHVPIGLQKVVADALDAINMDTMNAEERVKYYNDLIAKSNNPDAIKEYTKKRDFFEYRDMNFKERITALKNAYAEFKESDDPLIRNAHNDAIADLISNTASAVGNNSLKDMSYEQLEAVYDMYKAVLATVRNANKMFKEGRQETVTENSEAVKVEVKEVGGHQERVLKSAKFFKKFGWNMLKPVTAMKVIGSKTLAKLFDNVRAAEDTWAVDVNEAKEFYESIAKKYGYDKWDFKAQYTFEDSQKAEFSISLEQMLSLYAYSKRAQADEHLEFGGFIFDDAIEVTEKNKFGIPVKYEVNDANPHRLGVIQVMAITEKLTQEQRAFVDEMQTYLSDVMGAKGNEVSLALYDIKLYKEKNYFPLKTARYFREFDPEKSGTPKIKNSGFSKKTVPQAGNPIVLSNFMDVWASHVNDMSMYHAFVLPLEDFMRVYNYSSTAGGYDSVQQYIKNAYGSQANQYIERLMDDLNGGARVDSSADPINKGISLFKKASVFASASVVVQQPSAIARALAYINPKYFATSAGSALNLKKHKEVWAEVKQYAPVAVIKEMGYFDTGMGRSTVEWIKGNKTIKDKMDDALSKAPAMADELSWSYIWLAVKNEIQATTDLTPGSEEFLKKVGERFTEIITNTQVYDSVLSRSGMMRSKDTGMKMATAFMAEPTTTANMMVDGILQGKRGNKKFLASTVGAVSASVILNSILVALVYAARDDDEDETYTEKYVGSLTSELVDGFNPLTYIPFVKDIWSIAQGYDVERSDMSVVSNLWESIEGLFNENKSGWEKVTDATGAVSALFGIPLKNIIRDAKGMYNLSETLLSGTPTTGAGISEAIGDAFTSSIPLWDRLHDSDSNADRLYKAMMSGNTNQINRIKSGYATEQAFESAMRQALRDNDSRIKEAAQARYEGDIAEYTRIAKEIIREGNFSQDTVVAAINAELNAIKRGETTEDVATEEKDEVTSIYSGSDINSAFDNGDFTLAQEIISDLIETKVANGMEEKNAKSSLRSSMTSYWKPLYKEAYQSGDTNEMARIRQILYSSGLYGTANEVVKTAQSWLKS